MKASAPESAAQLKARALRALARREHSRAELARKLAPYAESHEILEGLLRELEGRKLLSDERFAESRAHVLARKYGAARIRQDLKARGVSDDVIERQNPADELARARAILSRKYRLPSTSREETAKRARFLQGRGFSYDVISKVLRSGREE